MLKALVQLFAESFLKSKSEWVGRQAYPSKRITFSLSTSEYIPPADGYVGFYKSNASSDNSIDVYATGTDGNIISRETLGFSISPGNLTFSGVIPARKGRKVVINGTFSELWFSPSVGSGQ